MSAPTPPIEMPSPPPPPAQPPFQPAHNPSQHGHSSPPPPPPGVPPPPRAAPAPAPPPGARSRRPNPLLRAALQATLTTRLSHTLSGTSVLSVRVPRPALQNAIDNGLQKMSCTTIRRILPSRKRVTIEAAAHQTKGCMFWTCGGVGPPRAVAPVSARGTCVRQGEMYDVRIVGAFLADLKREDGVLLFSHPVCGRGGEFVHVDPSEPSPGCETFFRVGATRSRVGGGVAGENAFIRICAVKISGGKRRGGVGRIVGADVEFVTCGEEDEHGRGNDDEEYGYDECRPYLKFGFYFFLSHKVDGQLYAQTSAAPDSVELLLNRVAKGCHGHNEKDFFPLTGVSYVVIEVRRGFRGSVQPEREDAGGVHAERVRELLYGQQAEGGD